MAQDQDNDNGDCSRVLIERPNNSVIGAEMLFWYFRSGRLSLRLIRETMKRGIIDPVRLIQLKGWTAQDYAGS